MIKTSIPPFSGVLTIGLEYGYKKVSIDENEIIAHIQDYQNKLIENSQIYLSVSITKCNIVLSGQKEPHLKIGFINYPKFPLLPTTLKEEIEKLANELMLAFKQNRVVIEYLDETIMLEQTEDIDPRISNTN